MSMRSPDHAVAAPIGDQSGVEKNIPEKNISAHPDASEGRHDQPHARSGKQPRPNNQPRRDKRDVHGWIVLDKPIGMTSTHAVAIVKRLFSAKRAGHAGTLDPLA